MQNVEQMIQIILMAQMYNKRPSELLGITDEYEAYCFDEVTFHLLTAITEPDGTLNWGKLRGENNPATKPRTTNSELINFIQKWNNKK